MYKCRECGQIYPSQDKWCSKCGGKLVDEEKANAYIMKHGIQKVEPPVYVLEDDQLEEDEEEDDIDAYDSDEDEDEGAVPYGVYPHASKSKSKKIGEKLVRLVVILVGIVIVMDRLGLTRYIGDLIRVYNQVPAVSSPQEIWDTQEIIAEIEGKHAAKQDITNKTTVRAGSPKDLLYSERFGQILAQVCGKALEELTWEDIDSIQYLGIDYISSRDYASNTYLLKINQGVEEEARVYAYGHEGFWNDVVTTGDVGLLHGLKGLDMRQSKQWSLELLGGMKELDVLRIDEGLQITELGELAQLEGLTELVLDEVEVSQLQGLEKLEQLEKLTLKELACSDLEVLESLPALTHLVIEDYGMPVDSEVLSRLIGLKVLELEGDNVRNLEPLETLTQLQTLSLVETDSTSIEWLTKLPELSRLTLKRNTNLKNLEPLAHIPTLRELSVNSYGTSMPILEQLTAFEITGISDLTPLAYMTHLEKLVLNGCDLNNPSVFKKMPNLKELSINNEVGSGYSEDDIGLVFGLSSLKTLRLQGSAYCIKDLSKLSNTSLTTLELIRTKIVRDMTYTTDGFVSSVDYDEYTGDEVATYVVNNPSLETLTMADMGLTVLPPMDQMTQLRLLDLSHNKLGSVETLAGHQTLQQLKLSGNRLVEVDALLQLPSLEQLWIQGAIANPEIRMEDLEQKYNVIK
ncbi:MAG: leucine-rich repeat domain-containing protein [Cellulosilyticaceae bacterium]